MSTDTQQQTQQPAAKPQPGTPEYNEQMVKLYEGQKQQADPQKQAFQQPQKPQRPEHIPEKFWDADKGEVRVEALAKSYAELERGRTQAPKGDVKIDAKPEGEKTEGKTDGEKADAGIKWDELNTKLMQNGEIADADFAALEKAGIPRKVAEGYVSAFNAAKEIARERSAKYVGGEQILDTILTRAAAELTPAERDSFNTMLANDSTAKAALDVLKNRFAPSDGEPQGAILPGGGSPGSAVGFGSTYEMTQAINEKDPRSGQRRYDVDPAYRAQVRQRIALSKF